MNVDEFLTFKFQHRFTSLALQSDQINMFSGSGQFGEVRRGVCVIKGKNVPVAVKTLKSENPQAEVRYVWGYMFVPVKISKIRVNIHFYILLNH